MSPLTAPAEAGRGRISTAALVASAALIAQILSACSNPPQSFSATSVAAQYPDLNDRPPLAEVSADQVAQIKAEPIHLRDNPEHAAVRQQHSVRPAPAPTPRIEPAVFSLTAPYLNFSQKLTFYPRRNWIERSSIEFLAVAIGDANSTIFSFQLWQYRTKFGCKLLSPIGCDVQIFKYQPALVSAFLTDHEVKAVVWHSKNSPDSRTFPAVSNVTVSRSGSLSAAWARSCRFRDVLHFGCDSAADIW
jgi:hypothetical protein